MREPHTIYGGSQRVDDGDPAREARFYAAALGCEVTYSDNSYGDDGYGMIEGNGTKFGFGKVEGLRPAQWPDEAGARRFHLDLQVDDLDEAIERLCALGASQPDCQRGVGRWRVLLDSEGQPFCLSPCPVATS